MSWKEVLKAPLFGFGRKNKNESQEMTKFRQEVEKAVEIIKSLGTQGIRVYFDIGGYSETQKLPRQDRGFVIVKTPKQGEKQSSLMEVSEQIFREKGIMIKDKFNVTTEESVRTDNGETVVIDSLFYYDIN